MRWLSVVGQDLHYAFRAARRQPGFALASVGMLAIGMMATTTLFALVNGLLLKPLPVAAPAEIVGLYTSDFSGPPFGASSYPDIRDWQAQTTTLSGIAGYAPRPLNLGGGNGPAERVFAEIVTANYFDVTGVRVAPGAAFGPEAASPAGAAVVVLSHALWQRRFGGDPAIVGQPIQLNGRPFVVRGIAPPAFSGMIRGLASDLWMPAAAQAQLSAGNGDPLSERGDRSYLVIGRLKPGVSITQVQSEFAAIAAGLHAAYPRAWTDRFERGRMISVIPESQARLFPEARGPVLGFFAVLLVVAGLVLIIACSNIANLLLARAVGRTREIATRVALGAGRRRIVQQLITEGLVLSCAAGIAGLVLTLWVTRVITAISLPVPLPVYVDLGLDSRVLLLTTTVIVLSTLLFSLAPALTVSRLSVVDGLKSGNPGSGVRRHSRLRALFIATQVAVSLVLLLGAGLFLRSLRNATTIDPGFDPAGVVAVDVDLETAGYDEARRQTFYNDALAALGGLSSVESAGVTSSLPLGLDFGRRRVAIEGYQASPNEDLEVGTAAVSAGYLALMRTRLVAGRDFADADSATGAPVAIVNEAFVQRYWPGQTAIGKRLAFGTRADAGARWMTVVGVTATGKYATIGEEPRPFLYSALSQSSPNAATLLVRARGSDAATARDMRAAIARLDRSLPLGTMRTMQEHLGVSLLPARVAGAVLGALGLVGLLLAAAGLYGVVTYAVSSRMREIGVRLSLGATPGHIVRLLLGYGLRPTIIGGVLGVLIAAAGAQALSSLLYGLDPLDPATFMGVPAMFAAIAVAASVIPAWRAKRVNPVTALRQE